MEMARWSSLTWWQSWRRGVNQRQHRLLHLLNDYATPAREPSRIVFPDPFDLE